MGGPYHFWLGASADADPALVASDQAAARLAPTGVDPLRYEIGEITADTYAAVFDMARDGQCLCLIDPNDCVGGMSGAVARAQDIANIFNKAGA